MTASDDINRYELPEEAPRMWGDDLGWEDTPTNDDMIAMAHEASAEPCGDPRCENGTIVGDEYVTRDGDVDQHTWDCDTCNPTPAIYTWDDMTEVPF